MNCNKTKIQSNIRVLDIIVKNIQRGLCQSSPIDYIMDIYGLNMRTAVDVSKLTQDMITLLSNHIDNSTNITEESIETFMTENSFTLNVIDYVLDRERKSVNEEEFTVKITSDEPLYKSFEYSGSGSNGVYQISKDIVKYCIKKGSIDISYDSVVANIGWIHNSNKNIRCSGKAVCQYAGSSNDKNSYRKRICNIKPSDHTWNSSQSFSINNGSYGQHCHTIYNNCSVKVWFYEENYETDYEYLTFYPVYYVNSNQVLTRDDNHKNCNDMIKIPLVDGTRMKTPLGYVSVKRTRTIDEYQTVSRWTGEDLKEFSQ